MEEIDRKKSHKTHLSKRKVLKKKLKKEGADKKERHNPKVSLIIFILFKIEFNSELYLNYTLGFHIFWRS